MGPTEILALTLCSVLILVIIVGFFRLKTPRRVSLEGIEDPQAAEMYDRISRMPQFGLLRRGFVKELNKHGVEGAITDIGCGPGYLLQVIAKEFPRNRLIGIDISKEMVEKARGNFGMMRLGGGVEFRQGSVEHLPFEDGTQDFLVSTLSLHHWDNPQLAFDEIYRVLRPGGQLLILDLRRDARRLFFWLVWFAQNVALRVIGAGVIRRMNEPMGSLLASYTIKELEEMMLKTPFSDYEIKGKLGWSYLWGRKKVAVETGN
jgi:ubiquinone/menaquinone biosynthesis C-methylase UbiE